MKVSKYLRVNGGNANVLGGIYFFSRLLRTVIHMRPSQVYWYIIRRLLKITPVPNLKLTAIRDGGSTELSLKPTAYPRNEYYDGLSFRFLNESSKALGQDGIDWKRSGTSRLWRYNLHYFEYLLQEDLDSSDGLLLMLDWLRKNTPFEGTGWEPYPTSLRIVNWIFFLSKIEVKSELRKTVKESIVLQSAWLEKNIEHHIQANHLLENLEALLFGGLYMADDHGKDIVERNIPLLLNAVSEQFFEDGFHFENSPMYHAIMVHGLLDLYNLLSNNESVVLRKDIETIKETARKGLDALVRLTPINDDVPFFNDSALNIAPPCSALVEYGNRLFDYSPPLLPNDCAIYSFDDAGYHIIRNNGDVIIIDCGDISPPYQPGHTHCDMLSFECWFDGKKVFTNCGNYDYELSEERAYARSTAAHNTLEIDGEEQSEIWGAFRVGRRAKIIKNEIRKEGSTVRFIGEHDGYKVLAGRITHQRAITITKESEVSIRDDVKGRKNHTAKSFLHLVHGYSVRQFDGGIEILDSKSRSVCFVYPDSGTHVEIAETYRFPEFGLKKLAKSLIFEQAGEAPLSLGYRIGKC